MSEENAQFSFDFLASSPTETKVRCAEVHNSQNFVGDDRVQSADILCLAKHRAKKLSHDLSHCYNEILKLASHIG